MDENTTGTGGERESDGRFDRARDAFRSGYDNVRERVDDIDIGAITDQVRTYVRSNPGKALLFSIGAGFVIGLLLRRDDDED